MRCLLVALALALTTTAVAKPVTVADLLANSPPQDWRTPDPGSTLYMDMPGGRVVIELAPRIAPLHVANITLLARAHYFDGLAVLRVQDNYVVQWADPEHQRPIPDGVHMVAPEFTADRSAGRQFEPLAEHDVYAAQVG